MHDNEKAMTLEQANVKITMQELQLKYLQNRVVDYEGATEKLKTILYQKVKKIQELELQILELRPDPSVSETSEFALNAKASNKDAAFETLQKQLDEIEDGKEIDEN